jgi:hypothetical protein
LFVVGGFKDVVSNEADQFVDLKGLFQTLYEGCRERTEIAPAVPGGFTILGCVETLDRFLRFLVSDGQCVLLP